MILVCTCAVTQAADQNDEQQRDPCDPGHDGEGSSVPADVFRFFCRRRGSAGSYIPPQRVHTDTVWGVWTYRSVLTCLRGMFSCLLMFLFCCSDAISALLGFICKILELIQIVGKLSAATIFALWHYWGVNLKPGFIRETQWILNRCV